MNSSKILEKNIQLGIATDKKNKELHEKGICIFCEESKVKFIRGIDPWSTDHWQCPNCDSTYILSEYKRKRNGKRIKK